MNQKLQLYRMLIQPRRPLAVLTFPSLPCRLPIYSQGEYVEDCRAGTFLTSSCSSLCEWPYGIGINADLCAASSMRVVSYVRFCSMILKASGSSACSAFFKFPKAGLIFNCTVSHILPSCEMPTVIPASHRCGPSANYVLKILVELQYVDIVILRTLREQ